MTAKVDLSDGEWKIMHLLWEFSPRTITNIVAALKDETGWAKTTVITMLGRLEAKGKVRYAEGERARQYYPEICRDEASARETETFLKKVYSGNVGLMVNSLVENDALSKEELDELREILDRAEREAKR